MDEAQWKRLINTDLSDKTEIFESNLINQLKHRQTFIKYKSTGRTYSRIYFFVSADDDAIHYLGSRYKNKYKACKIKDIDEIRQGFNTTVWKKFLRENRITLDKQNLAFSIIFNNNRDSLDLLTDSENIRSQWIQGLEYLMNRYHSDIRTNDEITHRWIWYLFSYADRDHSGTLNREEVRGLLRLLNIELDENEFDQYFNQANIRINNSEELRNLDKDEFLNFYKFISYQPELIKIICQFNGNTSEQTTTLVSEYNIVHKLKYLTPLEHPRDSSSLSFQGRRKLTASDIDDKKNYLTIEQLKDFLQKEQHMEGLSIDDSSRLIARFEPSSEGQKFKKIGVDGLRLLLLHDEFCIMNPNKSYRVYHDMTRPITDYFIATSHNTYIRDNQVYGDCTPETYIYVLRTGCRAVEMDCYDGHNMEPIVYHGNTLTRPITFREIIFAIETQAFTFSPYPLFLNIENHCSYEQQGIMAHILKETFKDHLLSELLVDDFQTLPSPEELKYKVIVRTRRYPKGKIAADPKMNRNNDETEPNPKDYHPDFASLIIYSQIVSFTNVHHTISTQKCFHSISFKESKADDLIKTHSLEHLDLIKLTQHHLVRVYPGGRRQDSSNIDPVPYWTYGVQMVALNYQSNDESMCLQHGLFSDNGGCGYLLKPSCLLSNNQSFNPKEKVYENVQHIQIHIISGQHLPKEKNLIEDTDIIDPYVEISTFGIQFDNTKHRTPSVRNNGLNPIWDYKINLDIYCPDLCLIKFQVRDEDRYGRSAFLGQACLPFTAIQCGYRYIKLKAKNGEYIRGTLFVHIEIDDK